VSIQNAICLGKRTDKPRLSKISLNSIQEKATVLKNKLKLQSSNNPSPVHNIITPDYTPLEQKKNKALLQQLADMNKGENVYIIKTVK